MLVVAVVLALTCSLFVETSGLDNGAARTPPMGWMSWQRFRCIVDCKMYPDDCISDQLFRKMADLMVSEGYLEAGYEYLVIDDCWLARDRDVNGRLQPDPDRFPHGIKDLSDYIHSKGLKFGMYEDYGNYTCAGYPGILYHLELDAQTFAEWEIDYIKIDGCYSDFDDMEEGYKEFGRYLNQTGRTIVYSCSWPAYFESSNIHANYTLLSEICNLWRNWGDIQDSYSSMQGILNWFADNQDRIASFAGPGHWNDPDMLLLGNYGLSDSQAKSQMALWAILAAPLLMSVDLRTIPKSHKKLLLNKGVIAINQDELGIQGMKVRSISNIDFWVRPITPVIDGHHSYAIACHSKRVDGYPYAVFLQPSELGLSDVGGYYVDDVFDPKDKAEFVGAYDNMTIRVEPSGVVLLKAVPAVHPHGTKSNINSNFVKLM